MNLSLLVPQNLWWWITIGSSLVLTSVIGEWCCIRQEMKDIPMNELRGNRDPESQQQSQQQNGFSSTKVTSRLMRYIPKVLKGRGGTEADYAMVSSDRRPARN